MREILIIFYSDVVKGDLFNSSILKVQLKQQKVSLVYGNSGCFHSAESNMLFQLLATFFCCNCLEVISVFSSIFEKVEML